MKKHDTEFPCPGCGYMIDSTSLPGDPGAVPEEGALSLCIKCATVGVFHFPDGVIAVRSATPEEFAEIMQDRGVVESRIIVLKMILSTL